ncbi:MAG: discoidin domain-containing protein [Gammaproteobacteria bacterium]|nr:discoidin domain-containing protein [Gammaproteobacteria bacterium]MBT8110936.1 discoidin domain-containing protein [Gammaproteobacteria bacterium]NND47369.1 hypothetical protein [Woeseiaceae bacterium]NNL45634.1 hypothetical protein [Woeseiaceae bacterium]
MKRYELFGLFALLTLMQPALAQQALVRSYENAALEIGQGYLSHYGDRCLAILPTHVAKEAGDIAAFLREGSKALLGESVVVSDLGDDVSVADVSGGITSDCGYSTMAVSRAVGSRIKANALASVRSVNGDGSIAQLSVTIIDDDGERFLRVQPTNDMNQLRKGQSGSLLMSGNTPIGMLLSVNARFGVGKVIRLDKMFEKVDRFVSGGAAIAAPTKAATPTTPTVKSQPQRSGSITSWSALPIDAGHRAVNLVADDDSPPWIANVDAWPVDIEMDLPGDRIAIAGIELDGRGVADAGTLPATIELMVSGSESGRRWRSVSGGAIVFEDGIATIAIAPSWARHIRLVISSAADGGKTVALARLRVIPAN